MKSIRRQLIRGVRYVDAFLADYFGPIRVLFIVRDLRGLLYIRPVFRAIARRKGFVTCFVMDPEAVITSNEVCETLNERHLNMVKVTRAEFSKWHYVFSTDLTKLCFRRPATRFQLVHGNLWGNLDRELQRDSRGHVQEYGFTKARGYQISMMQLVSVGHMQYFRCRAPDLASAKDFRAVITGVPKLDNFKRMSTEERRQKLSDIGLSQNKKTVVVTSHWTEKGFLAVWGSKPIEVLLNHPESLNVILLGHERYWREAEKGEDASKARTLAEVKTLKEGHDDFAFFPFANNPENYLGLADIFICDNSSVFLECLLFDRPILFFDNPAFDFVDDKVGAAYRSASKQFSNIEDLSRSIEEVLAGSVSDSLCRKRIFEWMLSRPGSASEFIADLLAKLGRVSGPQSPRWNNACAILDKENESLEYASKNAPFADKQ